MIAGARIVTLEPRHAAIVPWLREADREEIRASSPVSAEAAVAYSIAVSSPGWAVEVDETFGHGASFGVPAAVFGVRDAGGGRGEPWLVAADVIERHPVHFYRLSRAYIRKMRERYDLLENWADARNALSLRWLAWAGFTIEPAQPWGTMGMPFHRFWLAKLDKLAKRGERGCVR